MRLRFAALFLVTWTAVQAAPSSCPAGAPLGAIQVAVLKGGQGPSIPLNAVNRLDEGDRIVYSPVLRSGEKRPGKATVVLIASVPQDRRFLVLDPADASKPMQWTVPFRSALGVYVYGPAGLSSRKLSGLLNKDHELASQLADYAEKTAQTEAVLDVLSRPEAAGAENLGAALEGFARQHGINQAIDRSAPLNQQTMAALRTLNPALAAYDPIAPSAAQRMSQTAGLAATVAGMFLGSTVGLAAGSTAMALNLKTLVFPDSDFRSAYAQRPSPESVTLCTSREPNPSRKRIAYLWAVRIPDAVWPGLSIVEPRHVPSGLKSLLRGSAPGTQWKLAGRVREWNLADRAGNRMPVKVTPLLETQQLEIDLAGVGPGTYTLSGLWDSAWFPVGDVVVHPLSDFAGAGLTPESQNRLRPRSGKQLVVLSGADFQFIEKAAIVRKGDRYAAPAPIPFTLPKGPRQGPQNTVEMQVDTAGLDAGRYQLLLSQVDGKPRPVEVDVLPEPPKLTSLPLKLNEGDAEQVVEIRGEGLDRISMLRAEGFEFVLQDAAAGGARRRVRVRQATPLKAGAVFDLIVSVQQYSRPIVLPGGIQAVGPRPTIRSVQPSLPSDLLIALRAGELPARTQTGVLFDTVNAGSRPVLRLGCRGDEASSVRVAAGAAEGGMKFNRVNDGAFFISLDVGRWPSGCAVTASLENVETGESDAVELGRVVHLPLIEEFRLTDEPAGESAWTGILTGQNLELIGKTGWDQDSGLEVTGLPAAAPGSAIRQTLRIRMKWPSPAPRAPLYIWLRGEETARATKVRE